MKRVFLALLLAAAPHGAAVAAARAPSADTAAPSGSALVAYDPTPGAVPSATYQLTVDGVLIAVEHFKDVSYARFAVSGRANVVVRVATPLAGFVLSPLRRQIPVRQQGGELSFPLPGPAKLVLQCRGHEMLFLFADPPEHDAPRLGSPGVVNVLDYVPDRSGRVFERDAIQQALDTVAARPGGGVLYFPAGTYRTGTLVIHSHTTVYLESGALLQGTADPHDYYVPDAKPGRHGTGALLYFWHADDSRIIGRGTIAGRGTEIRKVVPDHPRICNLVHSRNCEIADVVIRDSGGFNIHALSCENLRLHGYKIINDLALSNEDGTDPDSSHHVVVDDVFMYTSDDAIAVKADVGLCDDVVVKRCVFWTKKSALKIGSDPRYGARNVTFEDNDVLHADRALALYARRGFIEGARYIGNAAEYVGDDIKRQTLVFLVSKVGPGGETSPAGTSPSAGYIKDVLVDGFTACRPSPEPSVIGGDGPGHTVSDVVIRNYYLAGQPVRSAAEGRIDVGPDVRNLRFEITGNPPAAAALRLPAWAK